MPNCPLAATLYSNDRFSPRQVKVTTIAGCGFLFRINLCNWESDNNNYEMISSDGLTTHEAVLLGNAYNSAGGT